MRWLILGGSGQLGSELTSLLSFARPNDAIIAPQKRELNLLNDKSVSQAVADLDPDIIVNCAAWTDVDGAESNESDAFRLNAVAPDNLARCLSRRPNQRLIQISTDYVFSGDVEAAHVEQAVRNPRSVYGRTKALGEERVLAALPDRAYVLRTAWLYSEFGRNFAKAILAKLANGEAINVVDDQFGHPTWAHDVAGRILEIGLAAQIHELPAGVYHAVNAGTTSWWGFARELANLWGDTRDVVGRVSTLDLGRPAKRPRLSRLSDSAAAAGKLTPMRDWQSALEAAFPAILKAVKREIALQESQGDSRRIRLR